MYTHVGINTAAKVSHLRNMLPVVVARPGSGKSEMARSVAQKIADARGQELAFLTFYLTSMDPVDLHGVFWFEKRKDGAEETHVVSPRLMPHVLDLMWQSHNEGKFVFTVFEEVHQAEASIQKPFRSFTDSRTLGMYEAPSDSCAMGLTNSLEDKSGVAVQLAHGINCQLILHTEPSLDAWLDWSHRCADVLPLHRMAMESQWESCAKTVPSTPNQPFFTPRSFVRACAVHRAVSNSDEDLSVDNTAEACWAGLVGAGMATSFMSIFRLGDRLPRPSDILTSPKTAKKVSAGDLMPAISHLLIGMVPHGDDMSPYAEFSDKEANVLDSVLDYMEATSLPAAFVANVIMGLADRTQSKSQAFPRIQQLTANNQHLLESMV